MAITVEDCNFGDTTFSGKPNYGYMMALDGEISDFHTEINIFFPKSFGGSVLKQNSNLVS